ncbi:MAG TPA: mechanosensitive ion channel family protein [Methylophilaceae bacterium]|nr:mechanosensitive ion channel family protein [Methylophilaceae bacterium]
MHHAIFGMALSELYQLSKPLLHILIILLMSWIAFKLASRVIILIRGMILERADNKLEELKRIETLSRVFRYLTSVIITIVTGMLLLSEVGISIAPILAGAGVVGIAIGFGAQSLVKDFFSGFFLLLENQIRQGDVIEVVGKSGLVQEITLRYVKLSDYKGNVHFIPNGIITTVTNMSREFAYAVIDAGVAYSEDIDKVTAIMRKVATDMRHDPDFAMKILEDIEIAGVENLANSTVMIKSRLKVTSLEQWSVRHEYLKRIKQAFDAQNIAYNSAG